MTIDKAIETKILRYHFVEQWGVNTIARQLGIHHSAVDRVLSQSGLPKAERTCQASIVDPYHPMIIDTLAQYPRLTAARLYAMAQTRGYTGGASQFRAHVAQLRPRKPSEAYLRLKTLPGEQGQVDWGHFGHVHIGRAKRPLMAFVMVLSWSRQIFLRFYLKRMDTRAFSDSKLALPPLSIRWIVLTLKPATSASCSCDQFFLWRSFFKIML